MTLHATPALDDGLTYVAGLIGLPHEPGAAGPEAFDCFNLFAAVQRRLFDRDVPWSESFLTEGNGPREILDAFRWQDIRRMWPEVARPRHGDAVLMAKARDARHIGIWVDFGAGLCGCLHATSGQGVVIETMAQLRCNFPNITFARCADRTLGALAAADRSFLPHVVAEPVAILVADILNPLAGAEVVPLQPGDTIWRALEAHPDPDSRWIILNTTPLLRRHPETGESEFDTRLTPGDVVWVLPPVPLGDNGGSQVLAALLSIVVTIAAPFAAGLIAPGLATSSLGFKLLTAGIAIGAQALISSLVPAPPQPAQLPNPEPTYSFGRFGNQMRPGSQIPRPFGTMHRQPDLLAPAWAEFVSNDQIVHILLCLGLGDQQLVEFGIDDTAVWTAAKGYTGTITDIEHELIAPGEDPTLFPTAIEVSPEVDGLELPEPDEADGEIVVGPFAAVPSGRTVTRLNVDLAFPRGFFDPSAGAVNTKDVLIAEGLPADGKPYLDPIDYQIGLGEAVGSGPFVPTGRTVSFRITAQLIDDIGQVVGFAQELGVFTARANTVNPQRFSLGFEVPRGRYQVSVSRITASQVTGSGAQDQIVWAGLRAQRADVEAYPDVTALAIRVRAGAASQAGLSNWYAITRAVLPHFDMATGEIVTGPTEQIDAAVLEIARASHGLDFEDARIDLDQLWSLAQVWHARGDVCCTALEGEMTCWDALTTVLRAGRTRPSFVGSTLTFVRDGPRGVPSRLITRADMVRGSFQVERLHFKRDEPTCLRMVYRDRRGRMRSMLIPPGGDETRPAEIRSSVHVDPEHAWRDGNFQWAETTQRRRFASWLGLAGAGAMLPGELVEVSHPRPGFGAGGRVADLDGLTLSLGFDQPLAAAEAGWLNLAMPDGSYWGPVRCYGVDARAVQVDPADFETLLQTGVNGAYAADFRDWIITEEAGGSVGTGTVGLQDRQAEPTRAVVGRDGHRALKALIVEVLPVEGGKVEVLAVEYAATVHDAELAPMPPQTDLAPALTNTARPAWEGAQIAGPINTAPDPDTADFTVTGPAVPGAVRYFVEVSASDSPLDWQPAGESAEPRIEGPLGVPNFRFIRVAAAGPVLRGPWRVYEVNFANASAGFTFAEFRFQED
jgi:hypothetical protein